MKAIILAGGLGTRLRSVISEMPKPMASVAGHPFLEILISRLQLNGISEITLSVGYQYEMIQEYFGSDYNNTVINYVIEETPLGTGGALKKAMELYKADEEIFVLNGDTFLDINYTHMMNEFVISNADVGIALKTMPDAYRYGRVVLDQNNEITAFEEKGSHEPGLINAGIYILRPSFFDTFDLDLKFSLEKDCFVKYLNRINYYPYITDNYFIDIGIPEDYKRAQSELIPYITSSALNTNIGPSD